LLPATGQFPGPVPHPVRQPHFRQHRTDLRAGGTLPSQTKRHRHVPLGGERPDQVEALENEPDDSAPAGSTTRRLQCYFRAYENDHPPRLVCDEFRTVWAMTPSEVDLVDGMG
jgi:hypothetical protein